MKFRKTILIVCEGTNTEPDYFRYLSEIFSYPKNIWDNVEISDNKTIPNDISIPAKNELGKRKKRQFENPNKHKKNDDNALKELFVYKYGDVEGISKYEEVKAVPLRYVAQAQLIEEEQQLYNELWAVFDKNGHTHHKEAFTKANEKVNDKIVNIGFSSRSFEQWILLHFERNCRIFQQTECGIKSKKGSKKILFECGKNTHQNDCKGNVCLVGYIRTHTPLIDYAKSNKQEDLKRMMNILLETNTIQTAFENAAWLRHKQQNELQKNNGNIYELNTYTNIDILVKQLIGNEIIIRWANFDEIIVFEKLRFVVKLLKPKTIEIEFSTQPFIHWRFYTKSKITHNKVNLNPHSDNNKIILETEVDTPNCDFCIDASNKVLMFEL